MVGGKGVQGKECRMVQVGRGRDVREGFMIVRRTIALRVHLIRRHRCRMGSRAQSRPLPDM